MKQVMKRRPNLQLHGIVEPPRQQKRAWRKLIKFELLSLVLVVGPALLVLWLEL